MTLRKFPLLTISLLIFSATLLISAFTSHAEYPLKNLSNYNFYLITDWGSKYNSSGDVAEIATQMNTLSPLVRPHFILSAGDNFHEDRLKSINDTSAWNWNFNQYFSCPNLSNLNWYPALGNHDYTGNPNAEIYYSHINPHWKMPARYYTFTQQVDTLTNIRFIIIDTSPYLKDYQSRHTHTDIATQNTIVQTHWLDSVLQSSTETWKIVIGHHPIYHSGFFPGNTAELITQIDPILRKYKVDFYFSGHVHTFQHNNLNNIDYISTASAFRSRFVTPWFYTKYFKSGKSGFTICSVANHTFSIQFIDNQGNVLYEYTRHSAK